jgi:hypothetical protein
MTSLQSQMHKKVDFTMPKQAQEKDAQGTFQFAQIHYLSKDEYRPLPEWALFFLELGKTLSTLEIESHRYTIALALPTRSYATALIGAGIACARIFLKSDDDSYHIETIYSLPEDTPLKYYDKGKVKKALKKDVMEYDGKKLLGIQVEDHTTIYLKPENVNKIEIADVDYSHLPNKQNGYSVELPSKLALAILQSRSHEFFYRSRIEGVVIGPRNILKEEADLELSIPQNGKHQYGTGSLSDLFRVKGFVPNNVGHRFLLASPSSNNNIIIEMLHQVSTYCPVIFDGASGFLKWKEMFADRDWIVILDQTDTYFPNAVAQLNQDYSYRSETQRNIQLPQVPSGIEVTFFMRNQ